MDIVLMLLGFVMMVLSYKGAGFPSSPFTFILGLSLAVVGALVAIWHDSRRFAEVKPPTK